MNPKMAIVTHADLALGTPDDKLLISELNRAGASAYPLVWSDSSVDWSTFDLIVVRSTWDYHLRYQDWIKWLESATRVSTLVNSPELQSWNSKKTYLIDLAASGIPIVPTEIPTNKFDVVDICNERGWDDIVMKPVVGASAFGTKRLRKDENFSSELDHFELLSAKGEVLIQPYQDAVRINRERSLVMVNGEYCHAFSKPDFHSDFGNDNLQKHEPGADELSLAQQVIASLPSKPLFARVDVVPSDSGPLLMEVELIEPELALHLGAHTVEKLATELTKAAS